MVPTANKSDMKNWSKYVLIPAAASAQEDGCSSAREK